MEAGTAEKWFKIRNKAFLVAIIFVSISLKKINQGKIDPPSTDYQCGLLKLLPFRSKKPAALKSPMNSANNSDFCETLQNTKPCSTHL